MKGKGDEDEGKRKETDIYKGKRGLLGGRKEDRS